MLRNNNWFIGLVHNYGKNSSVIRGNDVHHAFNIRFIICTILGNGRFTNKSVATKQTIDTVQQHLENNDLKSAFLTSANTFEELLFPDHEELITCKEFFTSRDYPTIMTGSGPTMVVLLEKPAQALSLQEEIKKAGHNWLSLITKTCTQEEVQ